MGITYGIFAMDAAQLRAALVRAEDKNRPCPAVAQRLRQQLGMQVVARAA
jgi:hypothetical protein